MHPEVLPIIAESLIEASDHSLALVTTHSPYLIVLFNVEHLRIVEMSNGISRISTPDRKQIEVVRTKLFTTGGLLKIEGLRIASQE